MTTYKEIQDFVSRQYGFVPNKYGWNADTPEGAIPDVYDTTFMSTSILSQKPSRIMISSEATHIL